MSDPNIVLETPIYHINITVFLSIVAICLTAFGTLVAVFRKKKNLDELPGTSPHCLQQKTDLNRIETSGKETSDKLEKAKEESTKRYEELKQLVNDTSKEVEVLKIQAANASKSASDIKQDVKEVASKLDALLKQLLDWMTD